MRRAELRKRARAAIREGVTTRVLCLACGFQGIIEDARPAELWKCPSCGRRALVRDEEEDERPSYVYEPGGSA